jgi:ABC-type antimicrobial peptide transport system permease subunit
VARGEGRRRELALRAAVGAGRGRLVRQLLAESLVLATLAGALAVLLAELLVRLFLALIPAARAARRDPLAALREEQRGRAALAQRLALRACSSSDAASG